MRRRVETASASAAGPQGCDVDHQGTTVFGCVGAVASCSPLRIEKEMRLKVLSQSEETGIALLREDVIVKLVRRGSLGDGKYGGRLGGNFSSLFAVGWGQNRLDRQGASRAFLDEKVEE